MSSIVAVLSGVNVYLTALYGEVKRKYSVPLLYVNAVDKAEHYKRLQVESMVKKYFTL